LKACCQEAIVTKQLMRIGRSALLVFVALALAGIVLAVATKPQQPAQAGGTCAAQCNAQFAVCYKASGANRSMCEAERSQCLEKCISSGG
jgi:threonine/homoserine efflux transporter RhtA